MHVRTFGRTNSDGLIPRAVKALKAAYPELGVMCDVALDPYTTHGQDGLIDETGYILNDETIEVLVEQVLAQARVRQNLPAPAHRRYTPDAPAQLPPDAALLLSLHLPHEYSYVHGRNRH